MRFDWKPEYQSLARKFLRLHFGDEGGITALFPWMETDNTPVGWHKRVFDTRAAAKNACDYKGLERRAWQYFATAQYDFAYHHWLLSAFWRMAAIESGCFQDAKPLVAVRYAIKQAIYCRALHEWQKGGAVWPPPRPTAFRLNAEDINVGKQRAEKEMSTALNKRMKRKDRKHKRA